MKINYEKLKKVLLNITKFLLLLALFYTIDILFIPIIKIFKIKQENLIIISLLSDILLILILAIIYRKYLIKCIKKLKTEPMNKIGITLAAYLLGLTIMTYSNIFLYKIGVPQAVNEEIVQKMINNYPIISSITTCICAPIIEEIIFRKALKDAIENKTLYIIASGLIFGGLHVINSNSLIELLYIIPYGIMGSAFAYTLEKTDNLMYTIGIHTAHNTAITLTSILKRMI